MRIIVHGVGAIGGGIAAGLALAGHQVLGVARGRQLQAIREGGLVLRTFEGARTAQFPVVEDPSEIDLRPDDAILLATKTQDTSAALDQLVAAGVTDQPVFCAQNGVENERRALRFFPNVHAINVMMPAEYMKPGEVVVFSEPKMGIFDIGRYPRGVDEHDTKMAAVLNEAGIFTETSDDIMRQKYGKLLVNLNNIVEAAIGQHPATPVIAAYLREEAKVVLTAAGIDWQDVGADDPRRPLYMNKIEINGVQRTGSSSVQSLAKGSGSIETDFMNGEIALLGRLAGVPAPGNTYAALLARRMVRDKMAPGSVPAQDVLTALNLSV